MGRFSGVDGKAEATFGLSPFQFANNNPINYNDPFGDLSSGDWSDLLSRLDIGINNGGFGNYGGSCGGGGGFTPYTCQDQAFGRAVRNMNATGAWGSQQGLASSFNQALKTY